MQGNAVAVPAIPPAIDWEAAAAVGRRCGPRTRGLVAARNAPALREWLRQAVVMCEPRMPEIAAVYLELYALVADLERVS